MANPEEDWPDVPQTGPCKLTKAAARGDIEVVRSLIADGVDVNASNTFGRSALQVVDMSNVELVRLLIEKGADVNLPDTSVLSHRSTNRTPLHDAAEAGFVDVVQVMVNAGGDVNAVDGYGKKPIDYVKDDHPDRQQLVQYLTPI